MGGPGEVETQKAPAVVMQDTQPIVAISAVSIRFPEVPKSYSLFQEKSDDRLLHRASLQLTGLYHRCPTCTVDIHTFANSKTGIKHKGRGIY